MFFPEKIKTIKSTDKVLEIGPGAQPHPRSDEFLEKIFDKEEALVQSGYATPAALHKKVHYYSGTRFPFEDNAFDYIICSHVIEHVPQNELPTFISEMKRVAKRGYIEFPTVFYEMVNYEPVHIWLMNRRDNKMLFMDKQLFESNNVHQVIRSMFYGKDKYLRGAFKRYKELFFIGFEWEQEINYEFVSTYNQLVSDADVNYWKLFFDSHTVEEAVAPNVSLLRRIARKIKNGF